MCFPKWLMYIILLLLVFYMPALSRDSEHYSERFKIRDDQVDVHLDIDAAEVEVRSGDTGVLFVEMDYSKNAFDIYTEFDEKRSRVLIECDKENWDEDHKDAHARIVVNLPRGTSIALKAKIKAGRIDMDFGHLALNELELTTWAGEVDVDFSGANRIEMSHLHINTKIGDTDIRRLGNARFKEADIDGGIGEMSLDFNGKMLDGAEVDIDLDIGETNLDLPDELGVKLYVSKFLFLTDVKVPKNFKKSGSHYYSQNYDDSDRSFVLRVSQGIGSLQFR